MFLWKDTGSKVNGDFVVQVKPRTLRRKVFGKLERDEGSRAGYCELNVFYGFEANRQTVKTDADGYYIFGGMPIDVEIALSAVSASTQEDHRLGTVELKASEEHAADTHTIDE